jgi:hypothetical protein
MTGASLAERKRQTTNPESGSGTLDELGLAA